MRSETVTTVLPVSQERVFEYMSDIHNLPEWATEFARELKYEEGKAKVVNGMGEFYFAIDADPMTGVIDMYAGADEQHMAVFPTRVVALSPSRSAYSFTMFKAPETDVDLFEAQYRSLQREFENIRARFSPDEPNCAP
jgi:hypothetical protein